jgi:hypothetical protein
VTGRTCPAELLPDYRSRRPNSVQTAAHLLAALSIGAMATMQLASHAHGTPWGFHQSLYRALHALACSDVSCRPCPYVLSHTMPTWSWALISALLSSSSGMLCDTPRPVSLAAFPIHKPRLLAHVTSAATLTASSLCLTRTTAKLLYSLSLR